MNAPSRPLWITIFLILLAVILQPVYAADPPLPIPVGRVVWVKGTFKAVMPNKEERTLQKASILYLKDTLETAPQSQAEIVFTDNSLMTFREKSTFVIDKYSYVPKKKDNRGVGTYVMRLLEGGFRTITGMVAKDHPDNYQVNTPVATIGVRGTEYVVYYRNHELFIGRYMGTPCVQGSDKNKSKLCLDETLRLARVGEDGAPVPLEQQPDVFNDNLVILPASISPFSYPGSSSGGAITSFCISQ